MFHLLSKLYVSNDLLYNAKSGDWLGQYYKQYTKRQKMHDTDDFY